MQILTAPTEDFIKRQRCSLTAPVSSGSSVSLPVDNAGLLAANDWIVVGWEGQDTAELVQIISVTGNTVVATLLMSHKSDEPIVQYRYNARKFYGSTTQTGSYVELTAYGSPVPIAVDNPQGTLLEYGGVGSFQFFKSTYWNTYSLEETDLGGSNAIAGDQSTRYCTLYAIKKQAGLTKNPYITDDIVEKYRLRAENEINSFLSAKYVIPLTQQTSNTPEVPSMVENLAVLLAAGYMDWQEFGKDGEGGGWLSDARSQLKKLQTPGGQQLLGSDNLEMTKRALSNGVQSYPNKVDNNKGPARYFTMNQKF